MDIQFVVERKLETMFTLEMIMAEHPQLSKGGDLDRGGVQQRRISKGESNRAIKEKPHSTYDKVLETTLSLQMNGSTFLNSVRKDAR